MTLNEELIAPAAQALTNPYLEGPYAPTADEITATQLTVLHGELPADLDGVYVRNGPNPQFAPLGRYHWFDGDGMLHAVHFEHGSATYRNRYIRTDEFEAERAAGTALWRGVIEPWDDNPPGDRRERNSANTDVVFHHGNLLSLWYRAGKPYALDPISLETRGVDTFGGTLPGEVSAHAKVDERTEEFVFFDYGIHAPYLRYGVADPSGLVTHYTGLELPGPRLPHDMAITENYSILMDLPLYNDPRAAAAGRFKLFFDRTLPSRFAVLPRRGDGARAQWFEAAPGYIYHTVNAWEEGEQIVLVVCRVSKPSPVSDRTNPLAQLLAYLRPEAKLHRYRFDLRTGATVEEPMDDVNTEFPAIDQSRTGQRGRWSYQMRLSVDRTMLFDAVIKYDVRTGAKQTQPFGDGFFGSELTVVPRAGAVDEDDAWLTMFAFNSHTQLSEVWIYHAADLAAGPVCRLGLPVRVPLGFHATWVSGERMRAAAQPVG
ncbi:carotenoid oxygenase family protein [Nocardia brasiliensis]|uniref:Dioxygenase n=1 Tax=Nocardia brasiliensis (strain ATCC 700358 / HUJEG-1) TaxID=1133849 RepID=K0EMI0_NOCB7|nr:carotenoid oxygenase family protein [Nocardia brasiliensis]AFU00763.1 carotenoid cleavage dioxygenase [Nocardia brasiliensis ATCC 700358]OCF84014.1 9-cis-epoxycarotenoid dioxygenase [Nocardia brasiliensis]